VSAQGQFGEAGQALIAAIEGGLPDSWELDEREEELLKLAAAQADVVHELEKLVERDGILTTGSTGQVVLHPGVAEARLGRLAIDRMLGKLSMPAPQKAEGESMASQRARKGGVAKWARRDRVEERRRGSA
jgi:hypothetical protein